MEHVKALRAVEEALFEVALWPRIIPKMMWMGVRPWRVYQYVSNEWKKDERQRFNDTMSPTMFWLIVAVLPYFLFLDHFFREVVERYQTLAPLAAQPWPVRLALIAVLMTAWPVGSAYAIQRSARKTDDKDSLRRLFLMHCIVLVPSSCVLFLELVSIALFEQDGKTINTVIYVAFVVMALYGTLIIAFKEVGGWFDRITVSLACFGKPTIHSCIVCFLAGLLILSARGKLPGLETPRRPTTTQPTR